MGSQPFVGVEYHRRAAAQQPLRLRLGPYRKFVQRAAVISGDQQRFADQIGFYVVEPQSVQPNIPQTGEKADLGSRVLCVAARTAVRQSIAALAGHTGKGAVHGHGLRRVFDSAGYT
jgi:hypothetical protein